MEGLQGRDFISPCVPPLLKRGKIKKAKGRLGRNYLTFFLC
jgi:hypothetical protein